MRSLLLSILAALALAAPASGSQVVDRDASDVRLAVDRSGRAFVSYTAGGRVKRVLVWGAVNAHKPDPTLPHVRFRVDYSGSWKTYRREMWRGFRNACGP